MTDDDGARLWELVGDLAYRVTLLESVINLLAPGPKEIADIWLTQEFIKRFGAVRADDDDERIAT